MISRCRIAIGPDRMPATIFVIAYDEHALAAFDAAALDYLLEPIDPDRFEVAWRRAERAVLSKNILDRAARLQDWLEEKSRSTPASTRDRLLLRDGARSVVVRLDARRFARIRRRFLVVLDALREVRPWPGGDQMIVLEGGAKLPVSRNHRHELERRLMERR